jgi:hypothetical protein
MLGLRRHREVELHLKDAGVRFDAVSMEDDLSA